MRRRLLQTLAACFAAALISGAGSGGVLAQQTTKRAPVSDTDALAQQINAAFEAQDWSAFYPFWFGDDTGAPNDGFVNLRTTVRIENRELIVVYADDLEAFDAPPPPDIEPASATYPDSQTTFITIRLPVDAIGEVSEVVALEARRLGPAEATLDDIRAEPSAYSYEMTTYYEFKVRCADGAECGVDSSGAVQVTDGEATNVIPHDFPSAEIALMAPSRAEAEALRAEIVLLIESAARP